MTSPYQQSLGGQPHLTVHHPQHYPPAQTMPPMNVVQPNQNLGQVVPPDGQPGMVDPSGNVGPPAGVPPSQPAQPHKDFNTALLCRIGQETVQEIVTKTTELFQTLKVLQPPNGTAQSLSCLDEKKNKLQESLKSISMLFKRLRRIHEKCNENCATGMEYTHIEFSSQSLIPMKDEIDTRQEDRKISDTVKYLSEEHKELAEQVVLKNRQLKEIMDSLRSLIWDINTMLTMRKL